MTLGSAATIQLRPATERRNAERAAHLRGWEAGWQAAMQFVPAETRAEADAYHAALKHFAHAGDGA